MWWGEASKEGPSRNSSTHLGRGVVEKDLVQGDAEGESRELGLEPAEDRGVAGQLEEVRRSTVQLETHIATAWEGQGFGREEWGRPSWPVGSSQQEGPSEPPAALLWSEALSQGEEAQEGLTELGCSVTS